MKRRQKREATFRLYFVIYPKNIANHAAAALERPAGRNSDPQGVAANLSCGSYVRFFVSADDAGRIHSVTLRSNGCGYMLAAANVLADHVSGQDLRDLHGAKNDELRMMIASALGELPGEREDCVLRCIDALRGAFSDLRSRRIEEFRGEQALICTCFSVTEERIEQLIKDYSLNSVEEVGDACNAGTGCGSCMMLIEELLSSERYSLGNPPDPVR